MGRVLSITEDNTQWAARSFPMTSAATPARAMPPVEVGSDEVSVRVRVSFELTDRTRRAAYSG